VKDIKPDNVLVNYSEDSARFSDVQLGDCGETCKVDPTAVPLEEGHIIGAAIFRSPEAMLNLRWKASTDIWSFGATVSNSVLHNDRQDLKHPPANQSHLGL
jgi:casein kinase II subunit alpha